MTLKEAVQDALSEWHVEDLKIDKDEKSHGLESVTITAKIQGRPVMFSYQKKLGMTPEHVATVLKSHVRSSMG